MKSLNVPREENRENLMRGKEFCESEALEEKGKGRISPPRILCFRILLGIDATLSVEYDSLTAVNCGNPLDVVLVGIRLARSLVAHADIHLVERQVVGGNILDIAVLEFNLVEQAGQVVLGKVLRRIDNPLLEDCAGLAVSIATQRDADEIVVVLVVGGTEDGAHLRVAHLQALGEVGSTDEVVEVDAALGNVVSIHNVCCLFE